MKRVSLILGVALLSVFTSCTSDDEFLENEQDPTKVNTNLLKVKSIASTSQRDGTMITENYQYDGSKLVKITASDGRTVNFTYAGDMIIRKDFYQNNVLNSKEFFEYNKQNLESYRRQNASGVVTYNAVFTNNSDGTVSVKGYSGSSASQGSQILDRKVFFTGSNVSKIENYITQSGSAVTQVFNYTYDSKNSPFKNIVGFDKLSYYDITVNSNSSNVESVTKGSIEIESVEYSYNGANYPSSANKGSLSFLYSY